MVFVQFYSFIWCSKSELNLLQDLVSNLVATLDSRLEIKKAVMRRQKKNCPTCPPTTCMRWKGKSYDWERIPVKHTNMNKANVNILQASINSHVWFEFSKNKENKSVKKRGAEDVRGKELRQEGKRERLFLSLYVLCSDGVL